MHYSIFLFQIVGNLMVIICTKIGITNHDEYSLVSKKCFFMYEKSHISFKKTIF
jgi:hypothetical protein